MTWRQLAYYLSSLEAAELDQEAKIYDPYFDRVADLTALDHLSSISGRGPRYSGPLVGIISGDRE